jgi:hypothetical protein
MIADIIVKDTEGQNVLLVEIKGRVLEPEIILEYFRYLETESRETFPFGMVADPENIYVLKFDSKGPAGPFCQMKTADMLLPYDPEYKNKRIFPIYLGGLIEAWLADLAGHWNMEQPPGSEQLAEIGLLQRLRGGTTLCEVPLGADSVR